MYRQQVADLARLYQSGQAGQIPAYEAAAKPKWPEGPRLFANVDGIKFLLHEGGCGGTREDSNNLCALIAGYIHHPNVAGATVLSLGCQNAQVAVLRDEIRKKDPNFSKPLYIFEQQRSGEEFAMLSEAIPENFSGLIEIDKCRRAPSPCEIFPWGSNVAAPTDFPAFPQIHPSDRFPILSLLWVAKQF